jgi:hypothetical protein
MRNEPVDKEKISETSESYKDNWWKMSQYDQDYENVIWHIENCMNYIIIMSEGMQPTYAAPPQLSLSAANWNESELLTLYASILPTAAQAGYVADAGMAVRIKAFLKSRRRYVRAGSQSP